MDPNDYLDVLGQQPGLQLYTQICSCFRVDDEASYAAIIHTLKDGLQRLSASLPWVAGQVVNEGSSKVNTGVFKIKPFQENPQLVVKDLRKESAAPTMAALRAANFPFSMLDEAIIAPRKTIPGTADEASSEYTPTFLLQANLITGGLLLTFVGQHNTMDMIGQGQVIHLFSKACHNEAFTKEEMSCANLARRNLVPLLDDSYNQFPELARQMVETKASATSTNHADDQPATSTPPKCSWAYFTFSAASLAALKTLAKETMADQSSFVSTDDTLSAFIWQSVVRTRLYRLSPTSESTLGRAVDVRRYMNISPKYPGLMQNMVYHTRTLQDLVDEPLGLVASQLRSAVDPSTSKLGHLTRALATFLHRSPDKNVASFTAKIDLSCDIMISSWAKLDCYQLDFNLGLGKPEAVRRPQFDPFESLIYLMPKTLDGDIAVAICLRDGDMERLRTDANFVTYGKYTGDA